MKKSDIFKFIEDEVSQIVKTEKSKPTPKRIVPKKQKPKELKEEDFDEIMFTSVNEGNSIIEIIRKIIKENYDFAAEETSFWDKKYYEDGLKKEKSNLTKSKEDYKPYHNSFSSACSEVIDFAKKRGYEVNEEDWFNKVSSGSKKPSEGKTNRYSIELNKESQPQKKMLHFQVYGMENGKYELNAYIN